MSDVTDGGLEQAIRPPKMAQVIADQVKQDIAKGRLPTGLRLPTEAEMIARYRVSRGVIREAMRLLESIGLVDVRRGPKGGAIVRHPTPEIVRDSMKLSLQLAGVSLVELYDAMLPIETAAARMAAENRPAEARAALDEQTLRQTAFVPGQAGYARELHRFHEVLIANCGNAAIQLISNSLLQIVRDATKHLEPVIAVRFGEEALRIGNLNLLAVQRTVAAAIGSGDGALAEREWRLFMETVRKRFYAMVPKALQLG